MYNEHKNDEDMRLKRDRAPKGLDSATFIGWILIPGVIGSAVAVILFVMLPSMARSLRQQLSINKTINNAFADVGKEFGHLFSMNWQDTQIWMYLLAGALLGIFLKYSYSDKLR